MNISFSLQNLAGPAVLALSLGLADSAQARDTIVAIAPDGTPAQKQIEIERLALHLLNEIAPGETAIVIDGQALSPIATFTVPEGAAYDNPRAKARANGAFFRALSDFADDATEVAGGQAALVDLPGVLRYIGDYHQTKEPTDIVIMGVPLMHDPKQPSLSMFGGAVPNDGHIIANPAHSPYGTAGRDDRLSGSRILIGMPDTEWALHDAHLQAVKRWVGLTASEQGGALVAFADVETILAQAGRDGIGLAVLPIAETDKREMIAFAPDIADLPVIYDREITRDVPSTRTVRFAEGVEVGITWDCAACDIDLYAVSHQGAEPIYFGNPATREGRLFKDHTRSPSLTAGYETIAFSEPVNLEELMLFANFYSGNAASGVVGEVRIAIGARTWAGPFRIEAASGNGSDDAAAALETAEAPNEAWTWLDPLQVVGLR